MNLDLKMKNEIKTLIDQHYAKALTQTPSQWPAPLKKAVETTLTQLDQGKLRVCEKHNEQWQTHQWIKKAILLYFKLKNMKPIKAGALEFYDKIAVKKWSPKNQVRVVPPAVVRFGSFVEHGVIVMPSFINIGAFVGRGTMVDTWATVGSCAQIGTNVHLSGGVGIGGVLEPIQANPVIIEDDCFIGSRSIIVEGVRVEKAAVVGAGTVITSSTPIIDVTGEQEVTHRGVVPAYSVVIPGVRQKTFPAGVYGTPCALIIGQRSQKTDSKTSLTQALREHNIS